MRAFDVAIIGVCAAVYAVVGRLTDFGLNVGGVAFWPAALIPAVFAVLFGPWTGGIGAAIGIFIRDMIFHGDPLLSLSAGVTGNFAAFFIIGYISQARLDNKKIIASLIIGTTTIIAGLLLPTILLPAESIGFTQLSTIETIGLFVGTVISSLVIIAVVSRFIREWRNYAVGSIIGAGIGSIIIASVVWLYSQAFFSPAGYFKAPINSSFIPIIFVWTFATEIPFILFLGPPIIKACYRAFPSLKNIKEK
ncbi:MAG: ECF transporter S component [Candidatus Bathyarchaeota archaeon]|nr:ECF transporter S component [Candidatus Bathyarchaeota archaeon]